MTDRLIDGIWAASLTPMKADLQCDHEVLAAHAFDLLRRGCRGIALFGTTGEGPSFSTQEKIRALKALAEMNFPMDKIILGNGSANLIDTIELAKASIEYACAAVLIGPPSFYKNIKDEGVISFYREIISQVPHPDLRIILYHIPQFSGVPISLNVIETLRQEFPQIIVGIKESEGNLEFAKEILAAFPGFKVFVGNEKQITEAVQNGASGSICGIANLYPELIVSLFQQGKQSHKGPNPEIDAVFEALKGLAFIPAAKAFVGSKEEKGWHSVRPPLVSLTTEEKKAFVSSLSESVKSI